MACVAATSATPSQAAPSRTTLFAMPQSNCSKLPASLSAACSAANVLQQRFFSRLTSRYDGTGFWQTGQALRATIDFMAESKDSALLSIVSEVHVSRAKKTKRGNIERLSLTHHEHRPPTPHLSSISLPTVAGTTHSGGFWPTCAQLRSFLTLSCRVRTPRPPPPRPPPPPPRSPPRPSPSSTTCAREPRRTRHVVADGGGARRTAIRTRS